MMSSSRFNRSGEETSGSTCLQFCSDLDMEDEDISFTSPRKALLLLLLSLKSLTVESLLRLRLGDICLLEIPSEAVEFVLEDLLP